MYVNKYEKKSIVCLFIIWIILILFTILAKGLFLIETKTFIILSAIEIVNILFLCYTLKK